MKIAVIGSRSCDNYNLLKNTLDTIKNKIDEIISGGAAGADGLAERYAKENNISIKIYKPDWKKYGRGAGIIRNKLIVENSDEVIAFWNGNSKGTLSTINYAKTNNKKIRIIDCKVLQLTKEQVKF